MKAVLFSAVIVLLGIASFSSPAIAHCGWCPMGQGGMTHGQNVPSDMRLTDQQNDKIQSIMSDYRAKAQNIDDGIHTLESDIDAELSKDRPDMAKIKELRGKRDVAVNRLDGLHRQMTDEIKVGLTDRQRDYYGEQAFESWWTPGWSCPMHGMGPWRGAPDSSSGHQH